MKPPAPAILFPVIWPLGTTAPQARPPWATIVLLGLNLVMLLAMAIAPSPLYEHLALGDSARFYQYFTCAFVPPCLLVGLIDMLFLWTLAPTLERRLGPWKLALLWLACGGLGAVAHLAMPGPAHEPLAGAMAPMLGLTGAMVVIFPRETVRVFIGMIFLITPIFARVLRVPVLLYAVIYLLLQFLFHRLDTWGNLPFVLDRTGFSPGALLGGLASGAALAGILHRPAVASQISPWRRPVSLTPETASAIFDEAAPGPEPLESLPTPALAAVATGAAAPESSMGDIEALFGNPGDSSIAAAVPKLQQAPKPRIIQSVPEDTGSPIRLDQTGSQVRKPKPESPPAEAEPPTRRNEPARAETPPVSVANENPHPINDRTDEPARPPRREAGDVDYHAAKSNPAPAPEKAPPLHPSKPEPLHPSKPEPPRPEPAPPRIANPEPQDEDEAIQLQLEPSEDTMDQAASLRDATPWPDVHAGRFSVILAPGRPRKIASVVTVLANLFDLSLKGAYQTLHHRHGILVDNTTREEAERVAEQFARAGHAVMVAALTNRIDFGGGLDLISIQEHGDEVLFTTVAQMIRAHWSRIVFLAGGRVAITPGAPPRVVLDLFLVNPRHHLRLWDNTFSYSKEMPRFRAQALRITEKATGAIHTRSLDKWLRDEREALHPFDSMIEYEHYVRWHLMAHLTPTKLVK